jgi:hypothetical protein
VKPVLQALVLAERVYSTDDGRQIICGTFNEVNLLNRKNNDADEATGRTTLRGGVAGSPYAYVSLTDVCDSTLLKLQFVSLRKNKVLFEKEITIQCQDRLATVEIVLALPHFNVPEAGMYAFEIVCEGEIIGSSRIKVNIREVGEEHQE